MGRSIDHSWVGRLEVHDKKLLESKNGAWHGMVVETLTISWLLDHISYLGRI